MRPVLLLDVDGVINVFPPPSKVLENGKHNRHWGGWTRQEFKEKEVMAPFIHSSEMLDALAELREHMDIMWLTTWQDSTQDLMASLIDRDDFRLPYLKQGKGSDFYQSWGNERWWKVNALEAEISANPRPFLWVDDTYSRALRLQVKGIAKENGVEGDLMRAYESFGLTSTMVKNIKAFFTH